jgi:hypothetical protein
MRRAKGPLAEDINVTTSGTSPLTSYSSVVLHNAPELQVVHHIIISMIDALIDTLNGAKASFVDLSLLKPMTERRRKVID